MVQAQLQNGMIFGDLQNHEYIYMPASEIGLAEPLCVFEKGSERSDLSVEEAIRQIHRFNLRPVKHPILGKFSC